MVLLVIRIKLLKVIKKFLLSSDLFYTFFSLNLRNFISNESKESNSYINI